MEGVFGSIRDLPRKAPPTASAPHEARSRRHSVSGYLSAEFPLAQECLWCRATLIQPVGSSLFSLELPSFERRQLQWATFEHFRTCFDRPKFEDESSDSDAEDTGMEDDADFEDFD